MAANLSSEYAASTSAVSRWKSNERTERVDDERQLLSIQSPLFQSFDRDDVEDEEDEEVGVLEE